MNPRTALPRLGLLAALALAPALGCSGKPPEPDTAEVTPSKVPEAAKPAPTPEPEPDKDAPKG